MAIEKTIPMALRVPGPLWRRIEKEAEVTNSTMTRIVLQAVTDYLGDECPTCHQSLPVKESA